MPANPNTCRWLPEHEEFNRAFSPEHSPGSLLLSGKPGCGKSVLMKDGFSEARESLEEVKKTKTKITVLAFDESCSIPISCCAVAYFAFSNRGDAEDNTLKAFLRSLLFQLFSASSLFRRTLTLEKYQLLKSSSRTKDALVDWPIHILKEIFDSLVSSLQPACKSARHCSSYT